MAIILFIASFALLTTASFESEMLKAHNDARKNVQPAASKPIQPLVWDSSLAAGALARAKEHAASRCGDKHTAHDNKPSGQGENWAYAMYGSTAPPPKDIPISRIVSMAKGWESEKASYDYNGNKCSSVCGHYTQMVWAGTTKVGCGLALCKGATMPCGGMTCNIVRFELYCRYTAPGNMNNQRPYVVPADPLWPSVLQKESGEFEPWLGECGDIKFIEYNFGYGLERCTCQKEGDVHTWYCELDNPVYTVEIPADGAECDEEGLFVSNEAGECSCEKEISGDLTWFCFYWEPEQGSGLLAWNRLVASLLGA